MATYYTKDPKKLKVERDGQKFKCTWTCGETYDDGVQFYYGLIRFRNPQTTLVDPKILMGGGTYISKTKDLPKKADKRTVTSVSFSSYYPTDNSRFLKGFFFSVRGNAKKQKIRAGKKTKEVNPTWSDWIQSELFLIEAPSQMGTGVLTYEGEYYSTYSYTVPKDKPHQPVTDLEWQACLVKGSDSPNWKSPDKKGVRKKSAASSFVITEDKYKGRDIDWNEPNYSYTRYVRIRARGPGGPGPWSTPVKHVYTMSKRSFGVNANLTKNASGPGYLCTITWTVDTPKTRPTDAVFIYYAFAVPTADMGCPDNVTWEEIPSNPIKDTKGLDRYSFIISDSPPLDHVMFVRIDTQHDSKTTPGYATYVKGSYIRGLTPPTIGSVTPDIDTRRVSLSGLRNNSEVPGSFLGVYFRDGYESGDGKLVGIVTDTSIPNTVQLPEWGDKGFALGLKAIAGATATASTTDPTKFIEETINRNIPTNTNVLSVSTKRTPIQNLTITINYTYYWLGELDESYYGDQAVTDRISYSTSFIGGTTRTISAAGLGYDDRFTIEYNGNSTFTFTISNSETDIKTGVTIDSISYTYATDNRDNIPIYYELKKTNSTIGMMESKIEWSGDIPLPPSNLNVAQDGINTILATWDWNWKEANTAEISWADHEDAWESTDEPQTYTIENVKASRWKIANLEPGNWYVKVRLIKSSDEVSVYGTYATANPFPLKVSSAPTTPALTLLPDTITAEGNTTASWAYEAVDGTTQAEAEIFEVTTDIEGNPIYTPLSPPAKTTSAQFITLYAETQGWHEGETHELAVRVKSTVDELSEDYSGAKGVSIVEKPTCTISQTNLVTRTRVIDSGTEEDPVQTTETIPNVLVDLPLRVTVTGAGEGGTTYLTIVRDGPYHGERPDGTNYDGFDGEVIASLSHYGEDEFRIGKNDRSGYFDDGGSYKIKAMVKDSRGQVAESEVLKSYYELSTDTEVNEDTEYFSYDGETYTKVDPQDGDDPSVEGWYVERTYNSFVVIWDHQAVMPDADIKVLEDDEVVCITPKLPEELPQGWEFDEGDTCDIYRLSADKPEKIISGGTFGTKYVDPYPTYGEFGGHRVVYVTKNGDYTIEETEAIADFTAADGDILDITNLKNFKAVIDFADERIELPYDISVSHKWAKDVTVTKYLDGSVTADWNQAVDMTSTVNSTVWIEEDSALIMSLRRLAIWPGYCHVRTPEGSSFTADVQVNIDHEEKWVPRLAKVSLSITRVDNYQLDGQEFYDWNKGREEE